MVLLSCFQAQARKKKIAKAEIKLQDLRAQTRGAAKQTLLPVYLKYVKTGVTCLEFGLICHDDCTIFFWEGLPSNALLNGKKGKKDEGRESAPPSFPILDISFKTCLLRQSSP